ncbi:MAG: TldD/PmbA family protein [Brevinematia bacterium]
MAINFVRVKDLVSKVKGDIFIEEEVKVSVNFEGSKLNSIENVEREGIGIRVIRDGKVGFSSTNDASEIEKAFDRAIEVSRFGEDIDISFPRQPSVVFPIKIYDPSLENVNERDMVELGEEIISGIKDINPSIEVNLKIEKSFVKKSVINSSGLDITLNKTFWVISVEGVYVCRDESLLWLYDSKYSSRYDIDFSPIISYLQNIFLFSTEVASIGSGKYPVIFAPSSLYTLIEILGVSLNGENVYKGISPIKDKVGEKVFSESFSLVDSPHLDWAIGSQPFDDEGVITNHKEIISNGVLKSFITDLRTSYLQNQVSTGNGFRSYSSLPKPDFSNIVVHSGDMSLREMISSIDRGLIVYNLLGGGQSNINAGEFSVNVEKGFLIEKGKIVGRVKDVMVFGNVFDLFKNIVYISKEVKTEFNAVLPYIMFDSVNVNSNDGNVK